MSRLDDYVNSQRERFLDELKALLRIPSVSTDPDYASECRRAADWLAAHLNELGADRVELLGSETHPVVVAERDESPARPTLLVYGHYDVQPPDPLEEWESPPFEPVVRNGDLVARGATDDKGQMLAILKAFEATNAVGAPRPNVRFLLEGQEESGGEVLGRMVEEQPELLHADAVLVADGTYFAPGRPSVELGVRGMCYVEIEVRTLRGDAHSGLAGGVAPNAHEALVGVLASLKSPTGRIRVPGVAEAVRRPDPEERAAWERLPFDPEAFARQEVGAAELIGDRRYSPLERMWARPTLDIHGISGGFTGEGVKTVIPAVARAKVSMRLVPEQRAATVLRQLTEFIHSVAADHAEVTVRPLTLSDPILVDADHPAFEHLDAAFREVEGRGVVYTRSGGSLPIVEQLSRGGAAVILAGIGLADDRMHAPNEKISLRQFLTGIRVFSRFMRSYSHGDEGEAT